MVQSDNRQQGVLRSLDWWTIGIYLALLTFGWISVCGASYTYGDNDIFSLGSRSGMQIIWIGTSCCSMTGFTTPSLMSSMPPWYCCSLPPSSIRIVSRVPVRGLCLDLCVCSQPSLPSLLRLLPFPSLCRAMASIFIA